MTDPTPEVVPPSSEPDAAVSTGSGRDAQGGTPPPPPEQSAGTGGIGTQEQQQGGSTGEGAPYSLTESDDTGGAQSPSGT